jgi:hypothetical protein
MSEIVTPNMVQGFLIDIVGRRGNAGPIVKDLEIAAARAKSKLELRYAIVKSASEGSVAERDAQALQATVELREASILATAEFNEAKRLHGDLSDNQMAWSSVLRKMLSDGA